MPLKVIGTDSGLLPAAVSRGYVMLMPGERMDVWAHSAALAGKQVILHSLSFDAGGLCGMDGGMGGGGMGVDQQPTHSAPDAHSQYQASLPHPRA